MKSTTTELFGLLSTIKVSIYLYLMDGFWWFYGENMIISFQMVNGVTSTHPISRFIQRCTRKICFYRAKIVKGNTFNIAELILEGLLKNKKGKTTNKQKEIVNISLWTNKRGNNYWSYRQGELPLNTISSCICYFFRKQRLLFSHFSFFFFFLLRGRMKHLNWNTMTGCSIINNSLIRLKQSQVS